MQRDPEGYFIILKGRIHQENINIVNIYAPNIGAPRYIRKILEDFKKDIDSNTLILGDFNTPLSKRDRSSKQNINKDIEALDTVLDQMDLTDIYKNFHPKEAKYTFFQMHMEHFPFFYFLYLIFFIMVQLQCTWNIFKDRPHDRKQNKPQQIQEN